MISVVIVTYPRSESVIRCIQSISAAADEIVVVIDGEPAVVAGALEVLQKSIPTLRIIKQHVSCKGSARNAGCLAATGDIIYFLDDDVRASPEIVALVAKKFQLYPSADVIGGPNLTPAESSRFQKTAGLILASPFVSFSMSRRYAAHGQDRISTDRPLILCNLAMRRSLFSGDGHRFDERLHYNEENLLLWQIARAGGRMMYCPDLAVYHDRRAALLPFARQVFGSGKGRAVMSIIAPLSFSAVFAMPALLVGYIVFAMLNPTTLRVIPLAIYVLYVILSAYLSACGTKERLIALLLIPVAHTAYGAGFITGIVSGSWKTKK